MENRDEHFLRHAIKLAATARERNKYPFGAVLVYEEEMVHSAHDHCLTHSDPTAHAERLVISEYCREHHLLDLSGYTLYSSTEPCLLCAGAIKWAGISRVVFSVSQATLQALNGGRPKPSCASLVNTGKRVIEVAGPFLEDEGLAVFTNFDFKPKRLRVRDA